MTGPHPLGRADAALRAQWSRLRPWVRDLVAEPDLDRRPSALPGWSVADLVAHLGRAMDALAVVTPAPPDAAPLSLRQYVGGYAVAADDIAAGTRALATDIAADPLGHVDRRVAAATARLDGFGGHDVVVVARRGPVRLSDMVVSRVVELVVHGDDLTRSLPDRPAAPVDPGALDLVAHALADVLRDAGGPAVRPTEHLGWVRLATGRAPADDAAVRVVLAPLPQDDVGAVVRHLPLL